MMRDQLSLGIIEVYGAISSTVWCRTGQTGIRIEMGCLSVA